jgi:hypothetical protein
VRAADRPVQLDDGALPAFADAVSHSDAASDTDTDTDAASDTDTDTDAASDGDTNAATDRDAYASDHSHADASADRDAATDPEGHAFAGARQIERTTPLRRHGTARHRDRDRGVFVSSRRGAGTMRAPQRECPENAGLINWIRMRYNKGAESESPFSQQRQPAARRHSGDGSLHKF